MITSHLQVHRDVVRDRLGVGCVWGFNGIKPFAATLDACHADGKQREVITYRHFRGSPIARMEAVNACSFYEFAHIEVSGMP